MGENLHRARKEHVLASLRGAGGREICVQGAREKFGWRERQLQIAPAILDSNHMVQWGVDVWWAVVGGRASPPTPETRATPGGSQQSSIREEEQAPDDGPLRLLSLDPGAGVSGPYNADVAY